MKMIKNQRLLAHREGGASLVEFSIVGLSVVLVGMFTLQLGLLYHAKTTINYATFEAARTGAVRNGSQSAIRKELGIRLAPLQGGDGSEKRALVAIARSALFINDPLNTRITILNPTREAFKDWEIRDPNSGLYFIPVNQLRHQTHTVGQHSGLSLRDANLLKLQVVHGVKLRVPVVGKLMTSVMRWLDSGNMAFYLRGNWPIQSVATVRMQSDSWKAEILKNSVPGASSDSGKTSRGDDNGRASTGASSPEENFPEPSGGRGTSINSEDEEGHSDALPTGSTSQAHTSASEECVENDREMLALLDTTGNRTGAGELMSTSAVRLLLAKRLNIMSSSR